MTYLYTGNNNFFQIFNIYLRLLINVNTKYKIVVDVSNQLINSTSFNIVNRYLKTGFHVGTFFIFIL